ncbi:MAG: hypothetical protein ACYC2Y_11195 [Armatimonadota bacterium]
MKGLLFVLLLTLAVSGAALAGGHADGWVSASSLTEGTATVLNFESSGASIWSDFYAKNGRADGSVLLDEDVPESRDPLYFGVPAAKPGPLLGLFAFGGSIIAVIRRR